MSSIDDIDDDVVTAAPVQTTSIWARKKLEREQEKERLRLEHESLQLNEQDGLHSSTSTTTQINILQPKTSTLFNRLKTKINNKTTFLPTTHDQQLEPLPTTPIDISKSFYTLSITTTLNECDLELVRLVAFFKACRGDSFEITLSHRLRQRELQRQNDIAFGKKVKPNQILQTHLPFLSIRHPHYPLYVHYTQIYRHIIQSMQKDNDLDMQLAEQLSKSMFEKEIVDINDDDGLNTIDDIKNEQFFDRSITDIPGLEIIEDVNNEKSSNTMNDTVDNQSTLLSTTNDPNGDSIKEELMKEEPIIEEVKVEVNSTTMNDTIATNNETTTTTTTTTTDQSSRPYIHPGRQQSTISNPSTQQSTTTTTPSTSTSTDQSVPYYPYLTPQQPKPLHPRRIQAMEYESKIISNMNKPPTTLITNILTTPSITLQHIITHAKYTYKQVLQDFHDKLAEQIELETIQSIDWSNFSIAETIQFTDDISDELLLPTPCTSINDLKELFHDQVKHQRKLYELEKASIEAQLKAKNIDDIDDIDDTIDSYMSSSRAGLSGLAGLDEKGNGIKRKQQYQLQTTEDDDDDDNLQLVTLSEAQKLGVLHDSTTNNNTTTTSSILQSKCEICQQMIPINEMSEHMKMELANPNWVQKQSNALSTDRNVSQAYNPNLIPPSSIANITTNTTTTTTTNNNSNSNPIPDSTTTTTTATTTTTTIPSTTTDLSTTKPIQAPQRPQQPKPNFDGQYMAQQHTQFLQQRGNDVPLPPGLDGMNPASFLPPMPPGFNDENGPNNNNNTIKRPYVQVDGKIDFTAEGTALLQQGQQQQPQQQGPVDVTIHLLDPSTQLTKSVVINIQLIDLSKESPAGAHPQKPSEWENSCMMDGIYVHTLTIKIDDAQDEYFKGQTILLTTPTLRISIGTLRNIIRDELLNKFPHRFKMKANVFLNKDEPSLAAYLIKHGDTIIVSPMMGQKGRK